MRDFRTPSPLYTRGRGAQLLRKFVLGLLWKLCYPFERGTFPAIEQLRSCTGRINDGTADGRDRDRDRDEWCLRIRRWIGKIRESNNIYL